MSKYEVRLKINMNGNVSYVNTTVDTNSSPSSASQIAQAQYGNNKTTVISVRKVG